MSSQWGLTPPPSPAHHHTHTHTHLPLKRHARVVFLGNLQYYCCGYDSILMQIKLIFTRTVVHLASFWKWGFLKLGSGLFFYTSPCFKELLEEVVLNFEFVSQKLITLLQNKSKFTRFIVVSLKVLKLDLTYLYFSAYFAKNYKDKIDFELNKSFNPILMMSADLTS